jgi:hypothetical protein
VYEFNTSQGKPILDNVIQLARYLAYLIVATPRWTGIRLGVDMPDEVRLKTQERAHTSPTWYAPGS